MTCHIKKKFTFSNAKEIISSLFPTELKLLEADEWNSSWDDFNDQNETQEVEVDTSWLQRCIVAISPTNDLLVFAHGNTVVTLTSKWEVDSETKEEKQKFAIIFNGKLNEDDHSDTITSALCLPIGSMKRSLHGGAECVCLIVGFKSGYLRAYTENGRLLLEQFFHLDPISSLKFISRDVSISPAVSVDQEEELLVVYKDVIVTVEALALFNTLRACRNQIARVSAGTFDHVSIPPLSYKKWAFQATSEIIACAAAGRVNQFKFDTFVRYSFHRKPLKEKHVTNMFLLAGREPYVGFYNALEVHAPPLISEMTMAIYSKLKSALLTKAGDYLWFNLMKNNQPKEPVQIPIEPATTVPLRLGVFDKGRQALSAVISPNRLLSVVTDTFGRVVLFDMCSGVALRMWKGYREAECGWIQVESDPLPSGGVKKALFLVIFAPKRGIVEIWAMQQGPRVAAFNVNKTARLIYNSHSFNVDHSLLKIPSSSCYLLDVDGSIFSFSVPFLCSFSNINSKRAKDLQIIKEIKHCLKDFNTNKERVTTDIGSLLQSIKTLALLQDALNTLINFPSIEVAFLKTVVSPLKEDLLTQEQLACEWKLALHHYNKLELAWNLYESLNQMLPSSEVATTDLSQLKSLLNFNEQEEGALSMFLDLPSKLLGKDSSHVTMTFHQFLQHFEIITVKHEDIDLVLLKPSLTKEQLSNLGQFLFQNLVSDVQQFKSCLLEAQLEPSELVICLLHYLLNSSVTENLGHCMIVKELLLELNKLSKKSQGIDGQINPWWQELISLLYQSSNIFRCFVICLILRSVCSDLQVNLSIGSDSSDTWETINLDMVLWGKAVQQFMELSFLDIFLQTRPNVSSPIPLSFSISCLQTSGQGAVTDIVSKWIVKQKLTTESLKLLSEEPFNSLYDKVYLYFRKSLDPDYLNAGCFWELMSLWSKDTNRVTHLTDALEFFMKISSTMLKLGVSFMAWKTFLSKKLEIITILTEKIGRTPMDKHLMKEADISELHLEPFLIFCYRFLDLMLHIKLDRSEVEHLPLPPTDESWQLKDSRSSCSLGHLALNQGAMNFNMVQHHLLLVDVLSLIVGLKLKGIHPLALFCPKGKSVFFKILSLSLELPTEGLHEELVKKREHMLIKAMVCNVINLSEKIDVLSPSKNMPFQLASQWLSQTVELAKGWHVSPDIVYGAYICELFSSGLDDEAFALLNTVTEPTKLAIAMYKISGLRVREALMVQEFNLEKLNYFTPDQTNWLQSLEHERKLKFYHPKLFSPTEHILRNALGLLDSEKEPVAHHLTSSFLDSFLHLKHYLKQTEGLED